MLLSVQARASTGRVRNTSILKPGALSWLPLADGVDLRATRPLIERDRGGNIRAVSVNNRSMEPVRLAPATSARFYAAYRRFVEILDRPDFAIEITLRSGELVAFDNRRVLHGRRAFRHTEPRHLQGCYVDMDAIRSSALLAAH